MNNLRIGILIFLLSLSIGRSLPAYEQYVIDTSVLCDRCLATYPRVYVRGLAGVNFTSEMRVLVAQGNALIPAKARLLPGYALGVAGGAHISDCFRLEGEVFYRYNCFHRVKGRDITADVDGDFGTVDFCVNLLLDMPYRCFTPYLGGGIGGRMGDLTLRGVILDAPEERVTLKDHFFVYQFLVGILYKVQVNKDLGLQYRYSNAPNGNRTNSLMAEFKVWF